MDGGRIVVAVVDAQLVDWDRVDAILGNGNFSTLPTPPHTTRHESVPSMPTTTATIASTEYSQIDHLPRRSFSQSFMLFKPQAPARFTSIIMQQEHL